MENASHSKKRRGVNLAGGKINPSWDLAINKK